MNVTQLKSLVAIAEAGSVSAASEAIGITQSGMSQALAALEESLGIKLLVRQRHGVELTDFGEKVVEHARAVLSHLHAIRREAAEVKDDQFGSIRIAAFPSVYATVLPALLRRFRLRYPDIEVIALETDDQEVEEWLESGVIDLGVVLNSTEQDVVSIGQDEWVAVLPTIHPLSRRSALTLAELAPEPSVLATGGCHLHAGTIMEKAGLALSNIQIEVRDWASAVALVRENIGVSIVPVSTLPESRKGLRVLPLDPPISRSFALKAAKGEDLSPQTRLMLELARKRSRL